jgi:DNA invertase Pin-like site-specific DNA recombinase
VDDGGSGAEFERRPAFLRLMNALKPRPSFDVLIMSEESRLGREAIETAYALKPIIQAGVRVFFYLENRERTLDSPTDKLLLSVTAFADELEREKARQRTSDAMRRKAKAGHVTGGRVFGYRNVDVVEPGPDGRSRRVYVRREIEPDEAAVVRSIFERCAGGKGLKGIAHELNAEGALRLRRNKGGQKAGHPLQFAKRCIAISIGVSWFMVPRRSGTLGAGAARGRSPRTSRFGVSSPNSRSSAIRSGTLRTRRGRSISRCTAPKAGRLGGRDRITVQRRSTCCRDSRGAVSAAVGSCSCPGRTDGADHTVTGARATGVAGGLFAAIVTRSYRRSRNRRSFSCSPARC